MLINTRINYELIISFAVVYLYIIFIYQYHTCDTHISGCHKSLMDFLAPAGDHWECAGGTLTYDKYNCMFIRVCLLISYEKIFSLAYSSYFLLKYFSTKNKYLN